jgi:fructokinase
MKLSIGLDIGGTKIAGASFDQNFNELKRIERPTPPGYPAFLETCSAVVAELRGNDAASVGVGVCGVIDHDTGNMQQGMNLPFLSGVALRADLEKVVGQKIALENDANCAALAEAVDGAGAGYPHCFTLIIGTGVGGGYVVNGKIVAGANGYCGEIGHLPLPYYEPSDGSLVSCGCGQKGCLEKLTNGAALARLHYQLTDTDATAKQIASLATHGNKDALHTLECYFTTLAKAMVALLHSFDPDIIVVSGGMNGLPGLYDEVPKRWGKYALTKTPKTRFVPAKYGAMAGLRGAALLGERL